MTEVCLKQALDTLGKPVTRLSYKGEASTYFTFQRILIQLVEYADDESQCELHTYRVNLFTKNDFTKLLKDTITVLKNAGFTISSVDPETYESDTELYHVPITINKLEEE